MNLCASRYWKASPVWQSDERVQTDALLKFQRRFVVLFVCFCDSLVTGGGETGGDHWGGGGGGRKGKPISIVIAIMPF